jgi:dihydroxy-acid dehydratase
MAMVSETLGLALPGSAMLPAVYAERQVLARRAGEAVMKLLRDGGPLPRDLVTKQSLENACAAVAATGGSTNAALHLPALAHEAGIRFTLDDVGAVFARTPLIADLQPGGRFLARDLHAVGGVQVVLRALLDGGYLHGECLALSGRTLAQELKRAPRPDGEVVRACARALYASGGVVVLKGNLCADGALIKIAGLKSLVFEGSARVFECEEDAAAGGTIALVKNGDRIRIDAAAKSIDLKVSAAELQRRRAAWKPRRAERLAGTLEKYARLVGPANLGAVTHSGAVDWPIERRLELKK